MIFNENPLEASRKLNIKMLWIDNNDAARRPTERLKPASRLVTQKKSQAMTKSMWIM